MRFNVTLRAERSNVSLSNKTRFFLRFANCSMLPPRRLLCLDVHGNIKVAAICMQGSEGKVLRGGGPRAHWRLEITGQRTNSKSRA